MSEFVKLIKDHAAVGAPGCFAGSDSLKAAKEKQRSVISRSLGVAEISAAKNLTPIMCEASAMSAMVGMGMIVDRNGGQRHL